MPPLRRVELAPYGPALDLGRVLPAMRLAPAPRYRESGAKRFPAWGSGHRYPAAKARRRLNDALPLRIYDPV